MKKHLFILIAITFSLKGCYQEPFDHTLLENEYWNNFSESVSLVAFDQLGENACWGFYNDPAANCYLYNSEVYDSSYTECKYFIHYRENDKIAYSLVDSIEFTSSDIRPKIEWAISSSGIIQSAKKYNIQGKLTTTEEYTITPLNNNTISANKTLTIKEKKKFNSRGELFEYLIYDENGNYSKQSTK